jgi:hypothetical protein
MTIASAQSLGMRACSRLCIGQTTAMMKSAAAVGPKTERAE